MATTDQLRAAYDLLEMSLFELWIGYFEVGGNRDEHDLGAYLHGDHTDIGPVDHDHIIDALNDAFVDRGLDHTLSYGIT